MNKGIYLATHGFIKKSISLSLILIICSQADAFIAGYDSGITGYLDEGGSNTDPAEYILGYENQTNRTLSHGLYYVGQNNPWNTLTINSGSSISWSGVLYVGENATSHNNNIALNNGSLGTENGSLYHGFRGSSNQLTMAPGTNATVYNWYMGWTGTANNNTALIQGSNTTFETSRSLVIGSNGSGNSISITNGASLINDRWGDIGFYSSAQNNLIHISGFGSTWDVAERMRVGTYGTNNRVVIDNFGLAVARDELLIDVGNTGENTIRLQNGLLAWQGDHTSDISDLLSKIEHDDLGSWTALQETGQYSIQYFETDEDGKSATQFEGIEGYDGLGGFTVITDLTFIPEPRHYSLILAAVVLVLTTSKRIRSNQTGDGNSE